MLNKRGKWALENNIWTIPNEGNSGHIEKFSGEFIKKQQCKKATRVRKINYISEQRWKLDDFMLENKAGIWKSVDKWVFKTGDDDLIYIENNSKAQVMEATSDGKVILEVFEEGKVERQWKKGKPDCRGYFILESHFEGPKVITAISENGLEIKGNIFLRWIIKSIVTDYLPFFTPRSLY